MREMAEANKKIRKKTRLANAGSCKIGDFTNFKSIGSSLILQRNSKMVLDYFSVRALSVEMEALLIYGEFGLGFGEEEADVE